MGTRAAWRQIAGVVVACLCLTPAAGQTTSLPDTRAYELASPPAKNGGDVTADSANTHAAAAGGAVVFTSLEGFGDVQGMGADAQYLSRRDPGAGGNGWVTHAITPRQEALTVQATVFGQGSGFEAQFTPDLSYGVYRTWRPLTDAPNVAETANLYLRGNLLADNPLNQLLSDAFAPVPPSVLIRPVFAGASSDLSHVIFESRAALTPDASFGPPQLYESVNGQVRLAGILPDGTPAGGSVAGIATIGGFYPTRMISADGSRILFTDITTGNIYMRVNGTTTVQLNESEKTTREAPQPATLGTASADGTRVFFITSEGLVNGDDDGVADVYMYDTTAPAGAHLTLISVDRQPADGHFAETVVGASADGRYVYFTSDGQLVADEPPLSGGVGLYVWHDGDVRFIGALADVGEALLDSSQTRYTFFESTDMARVTPDGRHLLFMTRSDAGFRGRGGFAGYDHGSTCTFDTSVGGPCRELYVYSADTGSLACASCDPSGRTATADAFDNERVATGGSAPNWHLSYALSDDGSRVFFNTAQALVPEDVNGKEDAYEYDVPSRTVHLLSSGRDASDSFFLDASVNGNDVFFVTRERLVGWDVDDSYDLYDARVGGGFPEPVAPPPPCAGETCRGQVGSGPAVVTPASATVSGRGNVRQHLRARHAARRRRCVRRTRSRRGARTPSRRAARCVRRRSRAHPHSASVRRGRRSR